MKKVSFLLLLALATFVGAQDRGFGIRLGDLNGFTFKQYTGKSAIEISLGQAGYFHDYYGDMEEWIEYKRNYDEVWGISNDFSYGNPLALQVHYLISNDLRDLTKGLSWYYGFGGQLRWKTVEVDYWYKEDFNGPTDYANNDRITNIDLGIDAVIGLEYMIPDLPLSAFLDATFFLEVVDRFFNYYGQAGIGVRYHF